jgi:hypothetical protein
MRNLCCCPSRYEKTAQKLLLKIWTNTWYPYNKGREPHRYQTTFQLAWRSKLGVLSQRTIPFANSIRTPYIFRGEKQHKRAMHISASADVKGVSFPCSNRPRFAEVSPSY